MRSAAAFSISIAPGAPAPIRLDFFGDTLESIRPFDPETQRSVGQLRALDLVPMSEAQLTTETIRRFRQGYAAEFGAPRRGDTLYEAVSEGRRAIGLEHWLPLFYERLDTLFDYVARRAARARRARRGSRATARFAQIADYYAARKAGNETDPATADYRPLKPDRLYLTRRRMARAARRRAARAADAVRGAAGRRQRHRLRRPGRARLRARAAGRERQRVRGRGRAYPGAARAAACASSSRAGATARASA